MAPPTPVGLPAISAAAENEPASLITLLGLTVDSSAMPPDDGRNRTADARGQGRQRRSAGDIRSTIAGAVVAGYSGRFRRM